MALNKKILSGVTDRQIKLTLKATNTENPIQLADFQLVIQLESTGKASAISYTPLVNTGPSKTYKVEEATGTYQKTLTEFLGLQEDATLAVNNQQEI